MNEPIHIVSQTLCSTVTLSEDMQDKTETTLSAWHQVRGSPTCLWTSRETSGGWEELLDHPATRLGVNSWFSAATMWPHCWTPTPRWHPLVGSLGP